MAAFSFPSYLSAPASINNTQISARFPNVSHQHLTSSTIASSSSLTLKCPVLSLPAPSNTLLITTFGSTIRRDLLSQGCAYFDACCEVQKSW
ncbi:hypothetical protein C1H46_002570 [Malus baccata]|uniref:Uncharacterized protein n=1 Tax=Malus baccata TaxID=106549 RepID=A0A540NL29_MALBA|nr:hypothetical protein C1H46_002570 [Malus baccata]